MKFELLGPLRVRVDGERVPLGGAQPEKALAALVLAGGRVVAVDTLVDTLWDGEPPPTATHQVQKVIAGLRRRIPDLIRTEGSGYRLELRRVTVDVDTFTRLAAGGTADDLRAALDLWRGPALAGLDSRALRTEAAALDERRLAATEALLELRLASGEPPAAVAADLPALIAAQPLRETLRRQHMLALYRCGRPAAALAAYAEFRRLLADELGLEPTPELARLQEQVLRGDPALDQPSSGRAPCTLPYDLPDFAGRAADLDLLLRAGAAVVITSIDGMAGVGKSALAVHAAHRLAERYPDGQLFCDLHAHTPGARPVDPETALERLLAMLGVPVEHIPDGLDARSARWRAELAGRRVLVVLDNATDAAQIRPLLPGTAGCLALVTSRRRIGMLDGAGVLSLDVLPAAEALDLLGAVAGADRVAAEPAAAAEVVRLCGRLPLAIRIAGTRLAHRPQWTIEALAGRLRGQTDRLAELRIADRGVEAAFALSYAELPESEQRMFRLLGAHPGADFDAWSAAALAGVSPRAAEDLLEGLLDAHLLRTGATGRYTFHDLIREYAAELSPEPALSRARLHDYFLAAVARATELISPEGRPFPLDLRHPPAHLPELPDADAALAWLSAEHATLLAVTAAGAGWRLPYALRPYLELRGHFADWRSTHERALAACAGDRLGTTLVRFSLGTQAMWTGRLPEGMEHFRATLAGNDDDPLVAAISLTSLGMLAHLRHADVEAAGYLREALTIDHGSVPTTAMGWNNLALTEGRLGQGEAAMAHHRKALTMARRAGSASAERGILLGIGETSLRLGLPAVEPFTEALRLARAVRFRIQEALALDGLAHATGDPGYWRSALTIFTELGVEQADLVRRHLAEPDVSWCDLCRSGASSTAGARCRSRPSTFRAHAPGPS